MDNNNFLKGNRSTLTQEQVKELSKLSKNQKTQVEKILNKNPKRFSKKTIEQLTQVAEDEGLDKLHTN